MPNGTSERSALIEHCGVGGSVRKGTLYPITRMLSVLSTNRFPTNSLGMKRCRSLSISLGLFLTMLFVVHK